LGLEVSSHPRLPAYVPLTNLMPSPLLSMFAFVVLAFVYDYGGAAPHAQVLRQNGGKSMFASSVSRLAGFLVFNIGTLHQCNSYIFMNSLVEVQLCEYVYW
jgi:hypothetical protein